MYLFAIRTGPRHSACFYRRSLTSDKWLAGILLACVGCWQVEGGWRLNGRKRWIGNATFAEVVVIWARSSVSGQVNAFVVRKGTPGFRTTKIENKIALRCNSRQMHSILLQQRCL